MICDSNCLLKTAAFMAIDSNSSQQYEICSLLTNISFSNSSRCDLLCKEDIEVDNSDLYKSFTFWSFVIVMSIGTICFNVINSISDAICFDVIGKYYNYVCKLIRLLLVLFSL